jgi:predicted SprT family Zn-dependent metalloprotease
LSSRGTRDLPQFETETDSSYRQNDKEKFIDAIIIHELAHLREKNHQKPFWDLVYRMMLEYESVMKDAKYAD